MSYIVCSHKNSHLKDTQLRGTLFQKGDHFSYVITMNKINYNG